MRIRSLYQDPRTAPLAILLGLVCIAAGAISDGHDGDLRALGVVLVLAGAQSANTMTVVKAGFPTAHRDGYRRGRRVARPVRVTSIPRQDQVST